MRVESIYHKLPRLHHGAENKVFLKLNRAGLAGALWSYYRIGNLTISIRRAHF